jgi:glycosyltransferase involved in cell wall biosynthesis
MMNKNKICVIIPTLNEESSIGKVIDEIPKQALEDAGYVVEIMVVDGISTDQTTQIARAKGARVVLETRRGKARAIRTALEGVESNYIFMLDGDFTYSASYIPVMLQALQKYPVVIGSRLKGKREKGALGNVNFIGNHLLTGFANILYGTRISDLCTGYWGFRREVVQSLNLTTDGFQLEADLLIQVARKGYRIGEIPILYRCRAGKAKLSGLKDGIKIAKFLFSKRFKS